MCDGSAHPLSICDEGLLHSCYRLLSYTAFLLFYLLIAFRFILPLPSIPGAIHGLQFNPHKESTHLLASGGADGEVFVMSLEKPDKPNVRIYSVSIVDCMISGFVTSTRMSSNAIITVCTTCAVQHCFLQ